MIFHYAFATKFKYALFDAGVNQSEAAKLIGRSKATISNWLAGTQCPYRDTWHAIAESLGLEAEYFDDDHFGVSQNNPTNSKQESKGIRRMTVTEAAKLLHTRESTVAYGLQQGVFPWGYGIKTADGWTYIINADRFESVEGIKI